MMRTSKLEIKSISATGRMKESNEERNNLEEERMKESNEMIKEAFWNEFLAVPCMCQRIILLRQNSFETSFDEW